MLLWGGFTHDHVLIPLTYKSVQCSACGAISPRCVYSVRIATTGDNLPVMKHAGSSDGAVVVSISISATTVLGLDDGAQLYVSGIGAFIPYD